MRGVPLAGSEAGGVVRIPDPGSNLPRRMVIGLLTASYAGLGWMANLRDGLTAMWDHPRDKGNFVVSKLRDGASLLGLGLAMLVSLALSALSSGPIMSRLVELLNMENLIGIGVALRIAALVFALGATWAVFTWVIARLPREPVTFRSAAQAGLIAAIGPAREGLRIQPTEALREE